MALDVNGPAYIKCASAAGVHFGDYGTDALLHGGYNNGGYLGKYNQRWGNVYANKINGVLYTTSDLSIKENIRPIEGAIAKLMLVNPVVYDIKESFYEGSDEKNMSSLVNESKGTSGVIAQELKEIYPQLVNFDKQAELHEVNYTGLIPHLIKAIQEQQAAIEELKANLAVLEKK